MESFKVSEREKSKLYRSLSYLILSVIAKELFWAYANETDDRIHITDRALRLESPTEQNIRKKASRYLMVIRIQIVLGIGTEINVESNLIKIGQVIGFSMHSMSPW
jgi:uncharacterized FAD-dependent dehydrogenase